MIVNKYIYSKKPMKTFQCYSYLTYYYKKVWKWTQYIYKLKVTYWNQFTRVNKHKFKVLELPTILKFDSKECHSKRINDIIGNFYFRSTVVTFVMRIL